MALNWIWQWGTSSGNLGSVEYLFIVVIPWFSLTLSDITFYGGNYGSDKLIIIIHIRLEYLMPYKNYHLNI